MEKDFFNHPFLTSLSLGHCCKTQQELAGPCARSAQGWHTNQAHMDIPQQMLNILLLFFSSFPLGLSVRHRFCISPPWSPQEVNVIAVICKVGNLILKLSGSQGKAAWEHSAFSYWPSRPCQLLHSWMKCMKMGFGTSNVLSWAAAASGESQPLCGQHWDAVQGKSFPEFRIQKSGGKFQNETNPRSNLGFSFQNRIILSLLFGILLIRVPQSWN